ncbi:MAG: SusE domain-containing protein [Muribaculaceae bacterium]|nr:SusE domain-containing protein [Muribaculaceae bacterium]
MKKLSIFLSALAIMGLAACNDDKTPVLNVPDSFTLNTPPTAEQYYELTPGGTIALTCSQPDYGFVATASYSVEISLDKETTYAIASNEPNLASFTINDEDVATGLCVLRGIENPDDWTDPGYQPLYIRAIAQLNNDGLGLVKSNWIELQHVKGYFAIPSPGYIYLVGSCSEWNMTETETLKQWRLYESDKAIGSKIYSGVFNVPAGQALFRFYTELDGDWDTFSYGPCNNHGGDAVSSDGAYNIACAFTDGLFEDGIKATKDNFNFATWAGGEMTIVVDMSDENNMTVTITEGAHEVVVSNYAYMVGNNGGWATPEGDAYDDWKLVDEGATGVYTGTFDMPADFGGDGDVLYCRFYSALAGWTDAQWAADTNDPTATVDGGNVVVDPGISYPTVVGQACFKMPGAAGHNITVTLDANNNAVTFTIND